MSQQEWRSKPQTQQTQIQQQPSSQHSKKPPEEEHAVHYAIATQLIAELCHRDALPFSATFIDVKTDKHYRVQVEHLPSSPLGDEAIHDFIVAGPPGVPCGCCGGSGVQRER